MPGRLLLVDDSPSVRAMLDDILHQAGYETVHAEDGIQGAMMAYRIQPDLILADLEMPRMNGFQLCRLLKADPATQSIPTIILTSRGQASAMFWGLDTGADRYVVKGASPESLLNHVSELLALARPSASRVTQDLDTWDIVEKVNTLLDDELFRATVVNALNQVVFQAEGIKEGIQGMFDVLEKIVDAQVLAFFPLSDMDLPVFFRLKAGLDASTFQAVQFQMLNFIAKLDMEIPDDADIELEGSLGQEAFDVGAENSVFFMLNQKGRPLGLLTLVFRDHQALSEEQKAMLQHVKPTMSLVVDNLAMYEKVKTMSAIDPLTQIYNRRHFMEILSNELARAQRYDLYVSLIMFDVDDFKHVNDTYNHLSGDLVLKAICRILKQAIRRMDIPARFGGEEFIVVLPETRIDSALVVAERLRKQVAENTFHTFDQQPIHVTISLGVVSSEQPHIADDPLEFIKVCDGHLLHAKRTGKNRVCH